MNHDELLTAIDKRLDKIENKLDKHLEIAATNKADIVWLRGSIKSILTFIISLAGGLILAFVKLFNN